jgi:hypothetical protein
MCKIWKVHGRTEERTYHGDRIGLHFYPTEGKYPPHIPKAVTCPCGLRGPPSWAWQQCNRPLRLGRP